MSRARRLVAEGIVVSGVRIDSGDLGEHARRVRRILDAGGLRAVAIVASGGLDEDELVASHGAPIDSFGIGTSLTTSSDAPALDCAYKLQEYAGKRRRKRSEGKATTWPGRKQVWRSCRKDGEFAGDLVRLDGESGEGEALLRPFMQGGRRIAPAKPLDAIRAYARDQLARLPVPLRRLELYPYPVEIGASLRSLAAELDRTENAASAPPP